MKQGSRERAPDDPSTREGSGRRRDRMAMLGLGRISMAARGRHAGIEHAPWYQHDWGPHVIWGQAHTVA